MNNITKKQKKTLTALFCILILVIAVQYFYVPLIKEKQQLESDQEKMCLLNEDLNLNSSLYEVDFINFKNQQIELNEKRKLMYEPVHSSEADSKFTNIFQSSGLKVLSAAVSEIKKDYVYMSDEENEKYTEYSTGASSVDIDYIVTGSYENICRAVSDIISDKSVSVNSLNFKNEGSYETDSRCDYRAELSLTLYMYDSEFEIPDEIFEEQEN